MRTLARRWAIVMLAVAGAGCTGSLETSLLRLVEARRLSGDLLVQFSGAVSAGNLAVMAGTDEASTALVEKARQATQAIHKDTAALVEVLSSLGYADERRLLEQFDADFAEYVALDGTILGLAAENTNLKAQRLAFGPAREAAEAFRGTLEAAMPPALSNDSWRVQALVATAVSAVRAIQVLQAAHNAEADDAVMSGLEKQMATAEAEARRALEALGSLASPQPRQGLTDATAALDQFMSVNAEIVALSRRNTNVRSLALSLGQKRTLTAKCEETLQALRDALAKRQIGGSR